MAFPDACASGNLAAPPEFTDWRLCLHADHHECRNQSYYRPDNLCIIVTGDIEADAIFAALEPVEKRLEGVAKLPPMERPFSKPVPDLTQTQVKVCD
jgi:Zn-dependent M16 (insulinase) family peptidase